jgi:AcrR family transcriptional regulator
MTIIDADAAGLGRIEKTEMRRRQVMEAAKSCFRRVGFHTTSMARIAEEARMSVGHIYRYFASKEALIEGIVREDMDLRLTVVSEALRDDPDNLFAALAARSNLCMNYATDRDRTALMLEIAAEASRNPKVRRVVDEAEKASMEFVYEHMAGSCPAHWTKAEFIARIDVLGAIFEGVNLKFATRTEPMSAEMFRLIDKTVHDLLDAKRTPTLS